MARNKNIRFMNNQMATAANTTFSSEQAAFPFSNALNTSRSRPWKPNGAFEITDANNKLYVDGLTATLTNAIYSGPDALATQIQTQANAVSSGWTITYSTTTNKFTMMNSGAATVETSTTTNAVWDTIGFTLTTDFALNASSRVADVPRIHTSEYITIDLGMALEVTFLGLIGPLDEAFSVSSAGSISVKANNIPDFDTPALSINATYNSAGLLEFIDADGLDTTYRYWKIEITDRQNANGSQAFNFGFFYIGDAKTFTTTNVAKGFSKTITDPSKKLTSEKGQLFFQTKPKYYVFKSMSIELMEQTERLEMEQAFYDLGISEPIFISIDPTQAVSVSADEYTKYCVFDSAPEFKHVFLNYYSLSMNMREVL